MRDPTERCREGHPWSEAHVCDKDKMSGEQMFLLSTRVAPRIHNSCLRPLYDVFVEKHVI